MLSVELIELLIAEKRAYPEPLEYCVELIELLMAEIRAYPEPVESSDPFEYI